MRFPNALAWHALNLARALQEKGNEVYFLCQKDSPLAEWANDESFHTNSALNLNKFSLPEIIRGIKTLRNIIREFKPDILNPHCPPGHTFLAIARGLEKSKLPLIRTVAEPRSPKNNFINRKLHEKITDGLIFTTKSSELRYNNIFKLDKILKDVIYPGIDVDKYKSNPSVQDYQAVLDLAENQVLMAVIARMAPEKGHEVVFEALTYLKPETQKKVKLIIAGEDSPKRTKHDLELLAKQFKVDHLITFTGKLADVRPLIASLDVGIISSTSSEAICRIALEYMSFGVPIISSDVNILPEIVKNNFSGWIFPNQNAKKLAECIEISIQNTELRKAYGKKGLELVESEFSIHTQLKTTLNFYQKTVQTKDK